MIDMQYPQCKQVPFEKEYFGRVISDPYHWLTDKTNPEVLSWVAEENRFTDAWFDQKELEKKIAELKGNRLQPLYAHISGWGSGFCATVVDGGSYSIVRLDADLKNAQVVIAPEDIENYMVFELTVCPADETKLCILGSKYGNARLTALVVDSVKRELLFKAENIFSCGWSRTKPVLYYSDTLSDAEKQTSISRVCGYDARKQENSLIYQHEAYCVFGAVHVASDEEHLILEMMDDYSHSQFFAYSEKDGSICRITEGTGLQLSYLDTVGAKHTFISKETAPFGEVIAVACGQTVSAAEQILAQSADVLEDGFIIGEKLYLMTMSNVTTKLYRIENGTKQIVPLPSQIGTAAVQGKKGNQVFLKFESFTQAPQLLAFDGGTMKVVQRSSENVYPDLLVEQRTAASTEDGTLIPYFIVRRKDAKPDGKTPTWIYAYGGYNISMMPTSREPVTELDIGKWASEGGIYVLASIRGGNEFGTQWHEAGMMMTKKNCYYDFIGITEQLIADGWTSAKHIAISGCSNGGLLMSALVTMRPDLFGCVIDSVPHTDMLQFAEDARGPMYITEYGNPRESREMFEYLLSYSPYHNVRATDYPAVYIQTGECDNNVPPYHGKKFAARMQERNTSANPILLRVLARGSHDRGQGEAHWQTIAQMHLFVKKALGL